MAETEDIQAATRKHCGQNDGYSIVHIFDILYRTFLDAFFWESHWLPSNISMKNYAHALDWICNFNKESSATLKDLIKTDIKSNLQIVLGLLDYL